MRWKRPAKLVPHILIAKLIQMGFVLNTGPEVQILVGPREGVLTCDKAGSGERDPGGSLLGIGLVLVNLFINDPKQERGKKQQIN